MAVLNSAQFLGQMAKTRQTLDLKKSWNWPIILQPATVGQILNMTHMQWPETEIMGICWNLDGKICEIT